MTDPQGSQKLRERSSRALLEALAASFFWGYIAIRFSPIGTQTEATHSFAFLFSAVLVGNIFAIAFAGFLGSRADERHLFLFGFVGSLVCIGTFILKTFFSYPLFTVLDGIVGCATSALLVLAWCERTSRKVTKERSPFLALSSIGVVVLVLVEIQIDPIFTDIFCSVLLIASCSINLFLEKHDTSFETTESTRLPRYVIIVMVVFGFMIGMLSLLGRIMATPVDALPFGYSDGFLALWTLFSAGIGIGAYLLFSRKVSSLTFAVLLPLVSLGLLLPPFIHNGFSEMMPAIISFLVICEATVYSIGPSNAKRTIKICSFQFVFWERAWGLVGLVTGYTLTSILFQNVHLDQDPGIVYAIFVVYAILSLTIATLIARTTRKDVEKPSSTSLAETCANLASRYGLTPRETEILKLVAQGRSTPYVQETLHIARGTAVTHMSHIYQKMGIHDRQDLIDLVLEERTAEN